ncbi:uncharacterized protein NFIA_039140 [Aspergillus fischeri NRRL 181]|uniref:Uncharacterized protein n=1 Tax=Neosartorya fischeri (strain ATCC 1020 / DSM 3700 / CBS 544.65 / FGSC A1164 / JCM 1740 / NRRL 181 / WB 181) TaxID=331117 RepID=A1D018_NEOFI|nr:uncharacterized protein NFIA_039140 [Aspergillus fischeri NRRL 181]EAW24338.1 hypothetical protein NFIA_039140 [Aspergillus fischeri NRRL 181]KAG2026432.1 hypothetical protein GB937_001944 [Aspergillus fischeri]
MTASILSLLLAAAAAVSASTLPSPTPTQTPTTLATTTAPPMTTPAASTPTCGPGSTLIHTTDCTMGTPVSYCYSAPPPISCSAGFFPGVYHPGHCIEASTCYPVDASWITTKCSNGGIPWSTSTLFEGVLAGETTSTTISVVSCSCARDQWYSMTLLPGHSTVDTFCMPSSNCPAGMSTATSTNEYCVTSPAACASQGIPTTTASCQCEQPGQTAVYPPEVGAAATGCA